MVPQPVKVSNSCLVNRILKQMQIDKKWHILSEFPLNMLKLFVDENTQDCVIPLPSILECN